jgi:hypothetical protein
MVLLKNYILRSLSALAQGVCVTRSLSSVDELASDLVAPAT